MTVAKPGIIWPSTFLRLSLSGALLIAVIFWMRITDGFSSLVSISRPLLPTTVVSRGPKQLGKLSQTVMTRRLIRLPRDFLSLITCTDSLFTITPLEENSSRHQTQVRLGAPLPP